MREIVVRPAVAQDQSVLVALLAQLGYELAPLAVKRAISQRDGILVAELNGEAVGVLTYGTRYQLHRNGRVTTIDALVVDDSLRSAGIGAALVDHLVALARREGSESVELHSHQSRTEAQRFYERAGFELTSNFFRRVL